MVRPLGSALTIALDNLTRVPALSLAIEDQVLHYAPYQSPGSADGWNEACQASDNSLVRVTDPTQAAQWGTWTALPGSTGLIFQNGLCAISNNAGTLRAFAQRGTGGNDLWAWTSLDVSGQTGVTISLDPVVDPSGLMWAAA